TFDAPAGELFAHALLAEAGDADHALVGCGALGEPDERRTDLSSNPEDDDVAGKLLQGRDQRRRRRGHHVLEVLEVAQAIRQYFAGLAHSSPQTATGMTARNSLTARLSGQQGGRRWQNMRADVQSAAGGENGAARGKNLWFTPIPCAVLALDFSHNKASPWGG